MTNGVLFIGDSLTEWFHLESYFPEIRIRNEGIAGDTTFGVLERIEEIPLQGCELIFLMIGINDIFNGFEKEDIIENLELIIENLQTYASGAKLYVQSILPVNEPMIGYSHDLNTSIRLINASLREYCEDRHLTYLDLHAAYVNGVDMAHEYTSDGAHLSRKGYDLWAEKIKALLD